MDTKRRVGGFTISAAWIVGFGRELFISRTPGEALAMLWELISPQSFYIVMVVLGVGGALYFGWPLLGYVRPSLRLRSHADLIDSCMEALESDHPERENPEYAGPPTKTASKTKSLLHQTIHALVKLAVPHPPFGGAVNPWLVFLSRLSAASRVGDLDRAKTIWPEMEEERRQQEGQNETDGRISQRTLGGLFFG